MAGGIAFIRAKEGWGGVHTENHYLDTQKATKKQEKKDTKQLKNRLQTTLETTNSETIITDSIYIIPHLWKKVNKTDFCFFT